MKPKPKLAICAFRSKAAGRRAVAEFLAEHGDDLPAAAIRAIRTDRERGWTTFCAPRNRKRVVAAMSYAHNDWYLCTLKNAAVHRSIRGRGVGTELYAATAKAARRDRRCLVLAADVTASNAASIKPLKRAGFHSVNSFCWRRGRRGGPGRILHWVKLPPRAGRC